MNESINNPINEDLKNEIISALRRRGCRITEQRMAILDIILRSEDINCKEIFYEAHHRSKNIGRATVYRMVNLLEELGYIERTVKLIAR